jgi:uncharacterized repeat protein (TIGR01451 family)
LPAEAVALALGQLDRSYEMDLAVAAGHDLVIVHGRDRSDCGLRIADCGLTEAVIDQLAFPFTITSLAVGDFVWDKEHRTDIALLGSDGAVHLVQPTKGSNWELSGPRFEIPNLKSETRNPESTIDLVRAKVSSLPTDDLIVLDRSADQLHIFTTGTETQSAIRNPQSAIVAVLPMRLNMDALSDLVILGAGQSAPAVVMTAAAMTFTVTTTADNGNNTTPTPGSLRQAILNANANAGADMIDFNIPGAGPHTIILPSALPIITDLVTIEGTTQPGFSGSPMIELNGASVPLPGLRITGGSSTVRGLVINRFLGGAAEGINLSSNGGNIIEGNFIGTDVTGTTDLGNGTIGVHIEGISNNIIGGTTAGARNVISGNSVDGIRISDGATENQVLGNTIGTDVTGTLDLGNDTDGVRMTDAPGNTIGGTTPGARNIISNSGRYGILIELDSSGNLVQGNYIGTDVTGTLDLGNTNNGVFINGSSGTASGNTIGGTTAAARNVISGNGTVGVQITGGGATGNLVQGNYIGTNATGSAPLGNSLDGVNINAPGNTIGGTALGAGNVISGNNEDGVEISSSGSTGNQVQGNFIGTDVNGTADLGNTDDGVSIVNAPSNTIGGTTAAARNIISGNNGDGVLVSGSSATGNQVRGNYIGTDGGGTADLGNSQNGVTISGSASGTIIGGTTVGARNLISGNDADGVEISSGVTGSLVQGNFIGTQVNGGSPLGNAGHGVFLSGTGSNNTIGSAAPGEGNTIAFNGGDGIFQQGGTGNTFSSNSIFSNTGLGIDLSANGVTANDSCDPDLLANNRQNFPVLTSATSSASSTTIMGTLNSTASTTFRLEFFSNASCDPSGNGEGETFLGSTTAPTDGGCNTPINVTLSSVPSGSFITATATDPNGNTSEFSQCLAVVGCTYSISPTSQSFSSGGGTDSVSVTTQTGCNWTAVSNAGWITITPGSSGSGNGTVNYAVAANTGFERTATMTIAGRTFTVTQAAAPCTITCPSNQTVNTGPGATQCGAMISYPPPTTSETCGIVACTPSSNSLFPVGTTTVTCTVADGPSCSFTETVVDTTPPVITLSGANPMTVECHGSFTDPGATASDACAGSVAVTSSGSVNVNTPGTYTITYRASDGTNTATATRTVNVVDTTPPTITCPANMSVACASPAGATVTFAATATDTCDATPTVSCTPSSGSTFPVGTTSVNCTASDDSGNSSACSFNVNVNCPTAEADLSVTKSANPDPVLVGSNLTYTIVARNDGPSATNGVTLTDRLPSGVTFVSANSTKGACTRTGSTVTCSLGKLNNGEAATVTIIVRPTREDTITNAVSVRGDVTDPNSSNNTAGVRTRVMSSNADLSITKNDSPDPVFAGNNLNYMIRVTNNGPGAATRVTLTDTLPPCVSFVSASAGCSLSGGTVTCNLRDLANRATAVVTITVRPGAPGPISNTASVAAIEFDPDPGNNSDTEPTVVSAPPLNPLDKIAFTSTRDGNPEIYVMNGDGRNQTRLTCNPAIDSQPAWSPDGAQIAFTSTRDGNHQIYLMDADGRNPRNISGIGGSRDPAWSPDGSKIAFRRNGEIYVMNADGSNQIQLTSNPAPVSNPDESPTWSPDGRKIAFVSRRDGNAEIYDMSPDGSNQRRLTNHPRSDLHPAYSPDGGRIAFTGASSLGPCSGNCSNIFLMNNDGSNQTPLTNNVEFDPTWSPGGTKIAFAKYQVAGGDPEIFVMKSNGSNPAMLTDSPVGSNSEPAWQPESRIRGRSANLSATETLARNPVARSGEVASVLNPAWKARLPRAEVGLMESSWHQLIQNLMQGHCCFSDSNLLQFRNGSRAPPGD